jgi:hypothetical protein
VGGAVQVIGAGINGMDQKMSAGVMKFFHVPNFF